jgi:hypothetical protein
MNYKGTLQDGKTVLIQNDGQQSRIQLQSDGSSQGTSFESGKWKHPPTLFSSDHEVVLEVAGDSGKAFFGIRDGGIQLLHDAPNLEGATKVDLKETDEEPTSVEMKPMAPMKPLEPMKPLQS